ncbi:protein BREAST CANCER SUSCEPTIBILITY 1 homolog [Mercurialis annua]|uniref:protein BREAST CANCER SUSCEPTIBILITY 1 homolog n=1 Tax=Mercurialis annua TaxID=3986 RepID=UPI00215FD9C9|nr:protein BREAST CANCER SUSCEPTIBILITY 1 homolog [Mercurialis annua]
MADPTHLEKMGRELKCSICLSLLNSAVSLTCNHAFCNSCIVKSMKSGSNCPVCKVPYQRREVRAAPHMDNLVSIYKSMEAASGFQIFVTQNPPSTKLFDEGKQVECETGAGQDKAESQRMSNGKASRKKNKASMEVSDDSAAKPSFPAKKRVQVPQCLPEETPTRPKKLEIKSTENSKYGFKNSSRPQKENAGPNGNSEPVLSPFFWLRDDEDIEKLSQRSAGSQFLDITPPHVPAFSDIKDSDDECPSQLFPAEEVRGKSNDADLFDSEMFEWTQQACSPELYSTPASSTKMQDDNAVGIEENQESRRDAPLQNSNANEQGIKKVRCLNSEHRMTTSDEELYTSSIQRAKGTKNETRNDKFNKRGRTVRKAALKKCAKRDAEHDLQAPYNSKEKSEKSIQNEARENRGPSLSFKKSKRGKKTVRGTSATQHEPVLSSSLRGESLNPCDQMLDVELSSSLGKKVCDAKYPKRNTGKMCDKATTSDGTSCSLRSKKRKVESFINNIEEIETIRNQQGEDASISKVDGKNTLDTNKKRQIHRKEFNPILRLDSNKKVREKKMKVSFLGISEDGVQNDHQEGKNNISAKETQLLERVTDVFTNKAQSNEEVQIRPGSGIVNHSVMLKKLDQANGVVLQSCQTLPQKVQCAFCLSSDDSKASGEMVHFCNGKPVAASYEGGLKVIHSHRSCAEWAPNVYFEGDTAINLEAELTRSKRIRCGCCGLKGAALGCYEKSCHKSFHVTCAKMTPQCRWDTENFVMLCPLHASSKLPIEDSATTKRIRKKCVPKRQKSNQSNQKQDVSTCSSWNSSETAYKLVICCSALTIEEKGIVSEFQRLSGLTVLKNWDTSVTHVIASTDENGACRRTLKILMGILEGKWILNIEWVKACMKATKPVLEDPFEILVDIHGMRDGPQLGRLRILNKQPKIFEGLKFYFIGDFVASYKGYIQDLIVAGGGTILHRKPLPGAEADRSPSTFIIYSIELPDKCDTKNKGMVILNQRRADAEAMASATGAKAVNNSWILNSIAACRLQNFTE